MSRMMVFCRTRFEGFHRWAAAPKEVQFLRDLHRHEFHVELGVWVDKTNRQCEFILLKRALDEAIARIKMKPNAWDWSCEDWCLEIRGTFSNCVYVEVSEDGENGARWEQEIDSI